MTPGSDLLRRMDAYWRAANTSSLGCSAIGAPRRAGFDGSNLLSLEGTYSEVYPDISCDEAGLKRLFKQFSFPGGISSHAGAETPGSIHVRGYEGGSTTTLFDMPEIRDWKWGGTD